MLNESFFWFFRLLPVSFFLFVFPHRKTNMFVTRYRVVFNRHHVNDMPILSLRTTVLVSTWPILSLAALKHVISNSLLARIWCLHSSSAKLFASISEWDQCAKILWVNSSITPWFVDLAIVISRKRKKASSMPVLGELYHTPIALARPQCFKKLTRSAKTDIRTHASICIPFRIEDLVARPFYGRRRPFSKTLLNYQIFFSSKWNIVIYVMDAVTESIANLVRTCFNI